MTSSPSSDPLPASTSIGDQQTGHDPRLVFLRKRRELFPFGPIISNKLSWVLTPQEEQILDRTLDRNFKYRQYTGLPVAATLFLAMSQYRRERFPFAPLDAIGRRFMTSNHAFALVVGSIFAAGQVGRAISVWQGYQEMLQLNEYESEFVKRTRSADAWGLWQFNLGVMFSKKVDNKEEDSNK